MINKKLIIYTDGGARGNPGPGGIGVVIKNENGEVIMEHGEYIGEATNNQAEYKAVIKAFELISNFKPEEINFFLDSELVVKQLKGEYKVKNEGLAPLFVKIYNKILQYKKVSFTHVRRDLNKEADRLVNVAIDRQRL